MLKLKKFGIVLVVAPMLLASVGSSSLNNNKVDRMPSSTDGKMVIIGKVLDFNHNVVNLQTSNGFLRVPRRTVIQEDEIRPGKLATAVVTPQDIFGLN